MRLKFNLFGLLLIGIVFSAIAVPKTKIAHKKIEPAIHHYLYVAVPGIRDYMGYGGHGLLVFDMDNNHQFVKRIETGGYHPNKKPSNVKCIAVIITLNRFYIFTIESLQRIFIRTGYIIWEINID
ncbi:MAG: hypothetical protein JWR09_3346, partial [Mucilaginibacter sp.]|nr:hypothetical protein [Mucilaginibacter sp.]